MNKFDMLHYVDHTLLKAAATWNEIKKLCDEAIEYKTASICIPPCYVKKIYDTYGDKINICTVIGFPLGYSTTSVKAEECKQALSDGANEFDMVINLTDVKNGDYGKVKDEISALKKVVGNKILKVIIETCYLTEEEKTAMCRVVTEAGADFIKTSTGFGSKGASLEDVRLFKKHLGSNIKIKAAGGIRSLEDIESFILEGCSRIGSSSAVELVKNL
jgi:deoxyribose-phosphate aldolase